MHWQKWNSREFFKIYFTKIFQIAYESISLVVIVEQFSSFMENEWINYIEGEIQRLTWTKLKNYTKIVLITVLFY